MCSKSRLARDSGFLTTDEIVLARRIFYLHFFRLHLS